MRRGGLGIVVISDDLPELVQTCNRVLLKHKGRLLGVEGENLSAERLAGTLAGLE